MTLQLPSSYRESEGKMSVPANTVETYDTGLIKPDLSDAYAMISPEETPFQTAIGVTDAATATYHEWAIVDLLAPDSANRVAEGENAPPIDAPTLGKRRGNYTQISDKHVTVSHTAEAVDAFAGNIQKSAKQIALKIRELKRDMEVMMLSNIAASPGASGTARVSAGLPNFIRTNITLGSGGAASTLSGTTEGYPNSVLTPGTAVAFTEPMLKALIAQAWTSGAAPTMAMVNANNKSKISDTFTGNSTRYKDSIDKRLVTAIDIYDSDFGELTIVPNRFQPPVAGSTYAVYILDPEFIGVSFLETLRQKPLAETGHARERLIWCEYTVQVDNEAALAMHAATTGA